MESRLALVVLAAFVIVVARLSPCTVNAQAQPSKLKLYIAACKKTVNGLIICNKLMRRFNLRSNETGKVSRNSTKLAASMLSAQLNHVQLR